MNESLPLRSTLGLILLVVVTYSHGWYDRFIFDDLVLIENNNQIKSLEFLPTLLGINQKIPAHRVIRNLSYAVDYTLWKDDPRGFHLTNLLIHLFNVLLVFSLGRLWLPAGPWPFLAALLWGVHPVQTEAVTYLSGRRDVLSAFFYLAAFLCYLRWRKGQGTGWLLCACLGSYILGCFTKEVAVTLPAVIFAWEWVSANAAVPMAQGRFIDWLRPILKRARDLVGKAPLFFGVLVFFPLAFTLYVVRAHPFNLTRGYMTPPLKTDVPSLALYGLHYTWLLIFPQKLSMDYFPRSLEPAAGWGDPDAVKALVLLGALALLTLWYSFRGSRVAFAGAWFVIAFLPMSNLFLHSNEPVAEHYLYLPSVGFAWAVVLGGAALSRRWPVTAPVVLVGLTMAATVLAIRTDLRNREWEDPELIYKSSLDVFPQNSRLWNNLGAYYKEHGDYPKAGEMYARALALSPKEPIYLANVAGAECFKGNYEQAEALYREALKGAPEYENAQLGLAQAYLRHKRYADAIAIYDQLIPASAVSGWILQYWRAIALRESGRYPDAVTGFEAALKLGLRNVDTLWQLAETHMQRARHEPAGTPLQKSERVTAGALLKEALTREPESPVLHGMLGQLYEEEGRLTLALAVYGDMKKLNPDYTADSALRQARVLDQLGRTKEAAQARELARSLGFDPSASVQKKK